ncbi:hypothetical protein GGF37_003754 [Kickxella alabastrina]|nr:hypothetical protein GGF37_003754 [Kickxella alabastrina]
MEHLIEKSFGTYPEDHSFGDRGLQYDSVANTVNHIGAFVEIFRGLNLSKTMKEISLFLMRTSIVPGFTTIDKTILARCTLSVTSRLRTLHKASICLDIGIPKIPPMSELLVKSLEEI